MDGTSAAPLRALPNVSPSDRLVILQSAAKELGDAGRTCAPLEKVLTPVDADFEGLCAEARAGDPALLEGFRFDSSAAREAWRQARDKGGAAGWKVLTSAPEWPERTFERDCEGLKWALNALAAGTKAKAPKPSAGASRSGSRSVPAGRSRPSPCRGRTSPGASPSASRRAGRPGASRRRSSASRRRSASRSTCSELEGRDSGRRQRLPPPTEVSGDQRGRQASPPGQGTSQSGTAAGV